MPPIKTYRDLLVWQKSMDLVDRCYVLTKGFPTDERFGLVSQIRRSAVSIAANIAEGHARNGPKQFVHQLSISRGSLRELETLLIVSQRQGYGSPKTYRNLFERTDEVGRMLFGLSSSVASSQSRGVSEDGEPET
jgi:four helix bundle protein